MPRRIGGWGIMASNENTRRLRHNDLWYFCGLLLAAFIVSMIPVLHTPFSWMQTFFHEISHGLSALLTGGTIVNIELRLDGSGSCTYRGGVRPIVAFSGYAGAAIWGGLIYMMADNVSHKSADRIAYLITGLILVTAIFWARDVVTFLVLGIIAVPFLIIVKTREILAEKIFVQFSGLYILLDAIKSPLHLLDGQSRGDGATLQDLIWVPEIVWVLVWMAMGFATLVFLFRRQHRIGGSSAG